MDAPNPSAQPTFASRTPLHIGAVALDVRDLGKMQSYYRDLLGLAEVDRTSDTVRLGAGGVTLLELQHRPDAKPDDARTAGLYHTAFLMPTRGDLARWLLLIAQRRLPVTGVSDHLVSEAIYLDDPEGNGVEVYCDRAPETWRRNGDLIEITTDPLDVDDLVRAAGDGPTYDTAPAGLRVGHVHLRVGDVAKAEQFYRDALGLAVTRRRGGASFMSSGGYHHHIAANVWHSRGAPSRDPDRAGLAWFSFEANDRTALDATAARLTAAGAPVTPITDGIETSDPWGTRIRLTA
jgi:catechol 2,3-dioxygenase